MNNSVKILNKFMNNNSFAKFIISQFVGSIDKLTYKFNKEILKEYKEIITNYKKLADRGFGSYLLNNAINQKYYKLKSLCYYIDRYANLYAFCLYETLYVKYYNLYIKLVNGSKWESKKYMFWIKDNDKIPPLLAIQLNYFD